MELKKDSNTVSIDMLLIVHSEKRRAAQGTHSDRQADPGALPQRRGGNARPADPQRVLAPRPLHPRARPPWGRPSRPRTSTATRPSPHGCLRLQAVALASPGNAQPRDCPELTPVQACGASVNPGSQFPPTTL